jgi:hypothetical protein
MSYLRGPLTRSQIKSLKEKSEAVPDVIKKEVIINPIKTIISENPPAVPAGIKQLFLARRGKTSPDARLVYKPYLSGSSIIRFIDQKREVDLERAAYFMTQVNDETIPVNWDNAVALEIIDSDFLTEAETPVSYDKLPKAALDMKNYSDWEGEFKNYLYRNQKLDLFKSPALGETSLHGETERDFRIRVTQLGREQRDEWTAKLRDKYSKKTISLQSKIRTAEERISREESQSSQQKLNTVISIGATILGAFLGRKAVSTATIGKAGTAMKNAGRAMKESQDVNRAKEELETLKKQLSEIEDEFKNEVDSFGDKFDVSLEKLETVSINASKTNIFIRFVNLLWVPYWQSDGSPDAEAWK